MSNDTWAALRGADRLRDPDGSEILALLEGNFRLSRRKLQLYAVACARVVWDQMIDPRSRAAVEVVERFADGQASLGELSAAEQLANRVVIEMSRHPAAPLGPALTARLATQGFGFLQSPEHRRLQPTILSDLFGGLIVRPGFDPAWGAANGGTAARIAGAIDRESRFADLPVLGDALEEAGCTQDSVLGHCRDGGPHFRGCWVVDCVLGRE